MPPPAAPQAICEHDYKPEDDQLCPWAGSFHMRENVPALDASHRQTLVRWQELQRAVVKAASELVLRHVACLPSAGDVRCELVERAS